MGWLRGDILNEKTSSKLKYKKLSDDEIIQTSKLYKKGLSQNEIVKILGVSTTTIGNTRKLICHVTINHQTRLNPNGHCCFCNGLPGMGFYLFLYPDGYPGLSSAINGRYAFFYSRYADADLVHYKR